MMSTLEQAAVALNPIGTSTLRAVCQVCSNYLRWRSNSIRQIVEGRPQSGSNSLKNLMNESNTICPITHSSLNSCI